LPIEQKESYYWIQAAKAARENIPEDVRVTFVADRESDIYSYFDEIPSFNTDIISRVCHDRRLHEGQQLYDKLNVQAASGTHVVELPSITGKRAAREAKLEIKFCQVKLRRPDKVKGSEFIEINVVEAKEVLGHSSSAKDGLCWRLLTTHPVSSLKEAIAVIEFYKNRWWIEQLFRTLKTQGLNLENSNLSNGESLKRLTALAFIGAVKVMQLVAARDGASHQSAQDVFTQEEQQVLSLLQKRHEGKTVAQKNCFPSGSLAWAAWIVARLGGWKGYKSERPPGPITIRNGLVRFYSIFDGVSLARALE
jgi:hypothetical protein